MTDILEEIAQIREMYGSITPESSAFLRLVALVEQLVFRVLVLEDRLDEQTEQINALREECRSLAVNVYRPWVS